LQCLKKGGNIACNGHEVYVFCKIRVPADCGARACPIARPTAAVMAGALDSLNPLAVG
jgi:hypothetical protein